jgi:hypothetical protein
VDGFSGVAIPHDRGFALVGNADCRHVTRTRAGLSQSFLRDCDLGGSNLLWTMLDPPGLRKDLIKFALRERANGSFLIEHEGSRTGCALIER